MMDHRIILPHPSAEVNAKKRPWMAIFLVFMLVVSVADSAQAQRAKRIACVGDSITEGNANADYERNSWPQILDRLLERDFPGQFQAANFGRSGATLLKNGHKPYWEQDVFRRSSEFQPQIVIINLGTNDATARNWSAHGGEFEQDYRALIEHYLSLGPGGDGEDVGGEGGGKVGGGEAVEGQ